MTPQTRARSMVRDAVRRGILIRPETCTRCGTTPPRTSNGSPGIQGHHHDYEQPLAVEWICAKCHRKDTPLPAKMGAPTPGERNGAAKLTCADVVLARQLRKTTSLSFQKLADHFGVDKAAIRRAISGKTWAHVQDAASPEAPHA